MRLTSLLAAVAALSLPTLPVHATTFTDNEFLTWSQVAWGDTPFCLAGECNISGLLENCLRHPSCWKWEFLARPDFR